jgi:hypothetical protein
MLRKFAQQPESSNQKTVLRPYEKPTIHVRPLDQIVFGGGGSGGDPFVPGVPGRPA